MRPREESFANIERRSADFACFASFVRVFQAFVVSGATCHEGTTGAAADGVVAAFAVAFVADFFAAFVVVFFVDFFVVVLLAAIVGLLMFASSVVVRRPCIG